MVRLTVFLKAKIIVLWEQGQSIKEIARQLGIARNTVRLWIRRYEETGDVKCARQGPRPVVYTNECQRNGAIVAAHSLSPFKTTASTAQEHGVSLPTVRRHLHAEGIHNYRPAKKVPLSEAHRQARIRFATEYENFDWENEVVIFTDEKCFKSDKDGRKILWRKPNTRFEPQNLIYNRTSGRITLGYWGWMSSMGSGELVEVSGRMNSETYLEILRDVMLPTVRNAYPDCQIYLVQDNYAVRPSRLVMEWLDSRDDISVINWPSKSPDLNPIENLWSRMVLNYDTSEIRTKQNLEDEVLSSWELMRGSDDCWSMVTHMRSRLQQVIASQSHPLRY